MIRTKSQWFSSKRYDRTVRRLPAIGTALLIAVIVSSVGLHLLFATHAASASWQFASSGLEGSGFQNVVAYSPFKDSNGDRPILLGADIAGIHRSVDDGKSWTPVNLGLPNNHVASIVFSDVTPGKVYAATDSKLAVSTDFGSHWKGLAGVVNFDGNGTYQIGGVEHPRPTGVLIAQDNSGSTKYLYVATATQGVKRSSDDGATWDQVALAGDHLRSIALDPSNPDKLYVADANKGLQVSTNARGAMTFARAGAGPDIPEELRFIDGKLYVAAYTAGILMYDGAWHALNNGISLSSKWESLAGYRDTNGQLVLYAGCSEPVSGKNLMKSTDGGATWAPISTGSNVTISPLEYGQTSKWWASGSSYLAVQGNNFVTADIAIDPDNKNFLLVAGRGGAKAVVQSGTSYTWYPSVHGLMVTVNNTAVADPHLPGRVYIGSMDYTFLSSNDHGKTIISGTAPSGAPSTGDYIALDLDGPAGQASPVYLAASVRGQNTGNGHIYSNPDPVATPNAWTDENIPVNNDVLAIGVGHDSSGARVILASITNNGLYRKVGNTWTKITGTAPFSGGSYGTFAWKPNTQLVYAMDSAGVWRSNAAGAPGTWVKIAGGSAGYDNIDTIVIDPNDSSIVYASDSNLGGVVRINGANTSNPTVTKILAISSPGPIAINESGALYAHDRSGARLMRAVSPRTAAVATASASGPGFVNIADSFYADNNGHIRSLAVGPDDYVYTASNSAGMTVGTPSSAPADHVLPTVTMQTSATSIQVGKSVTMTATASDNIGVTRVEFYVDNNLVSTVSNPPFTSTWSATAAGTVTLTARAYDAAGNVGLSSPVTLTINPVLPPIDTVPPTASLTVSSTAVVVGDTVTATATAADDVGVTKVEFYAGNILVGTDATAPYTASWTATPAGNVTMIAKAYDAAGNVGPSAPVNIVVAPSSGTVPGDTNNDHRVNAGDYSVVINHLGQDYPPADFNHDGVVSAADLAILLSNWTW